jgi:hypothetical protein
VRAAAVAIGVCAIVAACTPIEPVKLSNAPLNACPCDGYAPGAKTAVRCNKGRCEIPTTGSRPEQPFYIVVNVPTDGAYGGGDTFVFFSDEVGAPAFKQTTTNQFARCKSPTCISLPLLTVATGDYRVAAAESLRVRYPLPDGTPIPARVELELLGNAQAATFPQLPIPNSFLFPIVPNSGDPISFVGVVPTYTSYQRVFYPEPPFDELFPPRADVYASKDVSKTTLFDEFVLNDSTLDELSPTNRLADIQRDDGLDGWRVWLQDHASGRRISVLRKLSGTHATVQLDTSGNTTPSGGLGDGVDVVLEPPADYLAVPTYIDQLVGGQGLQNIIYPSIPLPVAVTGVVAERQNEQLFGFSARITFESASKLTTSKPSDGAFLHYTATVSSDDKGRFATVLPAGEYIVTTEPAEGTGFAKSRQTMQIDATKTVNVLTLQPPKRTTVRGRAVLSDGRPLLEAEVVATPRSSTSTDVPTPRPGQTKTGTDGRFSLELDQGPYALTVIPRDGTGFPRVVTRAIIPPSETDLPDVVVPPPSPLSFTIRNPGLSEGVVPGALVRIFAIPGVDKQADIQATSPDPVEIGNGTTDANGLVEILLAPGPR